MTLLQIDTAASREEKKLRAAKRAFNLDPDSRPRWRAYSRQVDKTNAAQSRLFRALAAEVERLSRRCK